MAKRVTEKAVGATFAPDMDQWWEESAPGAQPFKQKRPRYRKQDMPPVKATAAAPRRRSGKRREQALSRTLMYVTVGLLALCLILQVNRFSQIAAQTKKISSLVSEIKQLGSDRENMEVWLTTRVDLQKIKSTAVGKMGMDYPAQGQVRVVALTGQYAGERTQTAAISADSVQ